MSRTWVRSLQQRHRETGSIAPRVPTSRPRKIKHALRSLSLRTGDALWSTMQCVLDQITTSDAQGFFRHRGYAPEMN